jgi:hypothetical protein
MLHFFAVIFGHHPALRNGTRRQRHYRCPGANHTKQKNHQHQANKNGGACALIGRQLVASIIGQ